MNQSVPGSPTSTPFSSTFTARGRISLSAKTVRLSILPSWSVSSSTTTLPMGSRFGSGVTRSRTKPVISTTQSRPCRSQSTAVGSWISGSAATSSTRYPGGMKNVFTASSGGSTGDSFETFCTPGGHGRLTGEL